MEIFLKTITGNPPIINTKDLGGLFRDSVITDCKIRDWNFSGVTDTNLMFCGSKYNQSLIGLDLSESEYNKPLVGVKLSICFSTLNIKHS